MPTVTIGRLLMLSPARLFAQAPPSATTRWAGRRPRRCWRCWRCARTRTGRPPSTTASQRWSWTVRASRRGAGGAVGGASARGGAQRADLLPWWCNPGNSFSEEESAKIQEALNMLNSTRATKAAITALRAVGMNSKISTLIKPKGIRAAWPIDSFAPPAQ